MKTITTLLSVFVTDLAAYNEGILRGEWLDLPCSEDDLNDCIERVTLGEDHEIFITDFESDLGIKVSEYENIYELNETLGDIDENDYELIAAYLEAVSNDLSEAIENAPDCVLYGADSLVDLAYEFVEEGLFGDIPESIANYIDYEAIARDLGYDSYYETSYGVLQTN